MYIIRLLDSKTQILPPILQLDLMMHLGRELVPLLSMIGITMLIDSILIVQET